MKTTLLISLTFAALFATGQTSMEFINKLYIIDNIGNVDSVLFGNDSSATMGIDADLNEQNIIGTNWNSPEIRSIHRTSDSVDCPVNYWGLGDLFEADIDLKKDIRKSEIFLDSSIFFVFKIHATQYPVEIFSDFSEMFNNSPYNSWTVILKHHYECSYDDAAECSPDYQFLFTIADTTERYITVRLDFETGLNELPENQSNQVVNNPVDKFLVLDYEGRIQIYGLNGKLVLDQYVRKLENINVGNFKPGMYFIKTGKGNFKIVKI